MAKKSSKQKNSEKTTSGEFPKNSRVITESPMALSRSSLKWEFVLSTFAILFLIILASTIAFSIYDKYMEKEKLEAEISRIKEEQRFWEATAKEYPDMRDAYYQAAVAEYRLGNNAGVSLYLDKALELDSIYKPAKELKEKVTK